MDTKQLVAAVERQGLKGDEAHRAVEAVLGALRTSNTATMIFRKVADKSAPPEARRTIFMCG
jgi:hypothetical protein